MTYNEKYNYGKLLLDFDDQLKLQIAYKTLKYFYMLLVLRVTWNGYTLFSTLSLGIYLIQVRIQLVQNSIRDCSSIMSSFKHFPLALNALKMDYGVSIASSLQHCLLV